MKSLYPLQEVSGLSNGSGEISGSERFLLQYWSYATQILFSQTNGLIEQQKFVFCGVTIHVVLNEICEWECWLV